VANGRTGTANILVVWPMGGQGLRILSPRGQWENRDCEYSLRVANGRTGTENTLSVWPMGGQGLRIFSPCGQWEDRD
jgi:hypothetical protein